MTRHAALLVGALALAASQTSCFQQVDACAGQTGACLDIDLQGNVGNIDAIDFTFAGAAVAAKTAVPSPSPTSLPVAIAILLPETASGPLDIRAVVKLAGAPVGSGSTSTVIVAGSKARVVIAVTSALPVDDGGTTDGPLDAAPFDAAGLDASGLDFTAGDGTVTPDGPLDHCKNATKDKDETGVDCGGVDCAPCPTPCDLDGDGYQRLDSANGCPDSAYLASGKTADCDDTDSGVFPGSTTLSSKNCMGKEGGTVACALRRACAPRGPAAIQQDVDCNGNVAEGCPSFACDADGDGFIDVAKKATCDPGNVLGPHDCNDTDPKIFPGAPDKCGDAIAQNCTADTACANDADLDGYDATVDCDDSSSAIHPWATELCNGVDDDCDGLTDEGNPDATGVPMIDGMAKTLRCSDSSVGECGAKVGNELTGQCVCSRTSLKGLFFTQGNRTACPGETQTVDDATTAGARCFFARQPAPQSCNPLNPKDEDCDGRTDAPDGVNLAVKGTPCFAAAQGACAAGATSKVMGCDMLKTNCFAAAGLGGNPWLVCDGTEVCPVTEKCNGLDDNCDGTVPANERDLDGDGYLGCGPCSAPLKGGVLGCGDCADAIGATGGVNNGLIHPGAIDACDAVDNDCDPATTDGTGDCGQGPKVGLPACCSTQMQCRNTVSGDPANCGGCGTVCDARSNACIASRCVCGTTGNPCAAGETCSAGTCTNCNTNAKCGQSCVACSGGTPICKSDASGCVACNVDGDCMTGKWCSNNACVALLGSGVACTADNQCAGGHCLQGQTTLQCTTLTSCPGLCSVLNSGGTACVAAAAGSDPKGDCVASVANCKRDTCSGGQGATACDVPNGTTCGASTCSVNTQSNQRCSAGSCASTPMSCNGFLCNGAACGTTCSDNPPAGCDTGYYCSGFGTSCLPKLATGANACIGNFQCTSNNCTDGFCCDKPTSMCGGCQACNVPTKQGTCSFVNSGQDPHGTCGPNSATCTAGGCNGSGACTPSNSSVSCVAPVCAGSQLTTRRCDGSVAGSCPGAMTVPCPGGFSCASATACRTTCSVDSDCDTSMFYCIGGAGSCAAKKAPGSVCTGATQCLSGHCLLDQTGSTKRCSNVPTCPSCQVTDPAGNCVPAADNTNPKMDCMAMALPQVATYTCIAGTCAIASCVNPYKDCNANFADGCETNLTLTSSCGNCGVVCDTTNSNGAACNGTSCTYASCKPGFGNCNTMAPDSNGCETSIVNNPNCGSCGVACDVPPSPMGIQCVNFMCGCNNNMDCPSPALPVCDSFIRKCVECVGGGDCTPTKPRCSAPSAGSCTTCTVTSDCTNAGWGFLCDGMGRCQCNNNSDCMNSRALRCSGAAPAFCVCGQTGGPCPIGKICSSSTSNATCN